MKTKHFLFLALWFSFFLLYTFHALETPNTERVFITGLKPEFQNVPIYQTDHPINNFWVWTGKLYKWEDYEIWGHYHPVSDEVVYWKNAPMDKTSLICHELCHHVYYKQFTPEQRAYYDNSEQFSEECEKHIERCYEI